MPWPSLGYRCGVAHDDAPSLDGDSSIAAALTGGTPQRAGWFRFYFDDERWEWSPEVARLHGYEPETVEPTTRLVLSHKHPDDYGHVAATLEGIRQTHQPFSTRHRIITVQAQTREVVVVGERLYDHAGEAIGTHGFYIDVTPTRQARAAMLDQAVAEFEDNRATIEQAKGILMFVYRIDSQAAFELLRWRSQETNTKLRTLAEQLLADVLALDYGETPPRRTTFDSILLTTHQRIGAHSAQT